MPASVEVAGRVLRVTNLDKTMYPEAGVTKGDVLDYYAAIAPTMVPHLAGRPATRKRWVHGVDGPAFFTKDADSGTPDWLRTAVIEHTERPLRYPVVDDAAALVFLAQLAALEIHVPQWRFGPGDVPRPPDRLVLDLDPGEGVGLPECVVVARLIKEILDAVGLPSVPVTSGSKGIHLYAGLDGHLDSDEASDFARRLATGLAASHPDLVVSAMRRDLRPGKVFIDWSQNNGSKTTVSPYSLRGRARPHVAAPRTWDELTPDVRQLTFREVLERLGSGDPLAVLLPDAPRPGDPLPPDAPRPGAPLPPDAPRPGAPLPPDASGTPERLPAPAAHRVEAADAPDAPRTPGRVPTLAELPRYRPMLATASAPGQVRGDDWHYEVKWDGFRGIAAVASDGWAIDSRGGIGLAERFAELGEVADVLRGHAAVLDGEIVALDAEGRSRFELLQRHGRSGASAHYMAFDLLWADGVEYVGRPYVERRAALESLVGKGGRFVHVPETFGTDRELALAASEQLGLEGLVAKRPEGTYASGRRSATWLKLKNASHQTAVVVGWKPGHGQRGAIGSLLLAVVGDAGLRYAGAVGSGFTQQALADAATLLAPLEIATPPVGGVPASDARGAHWVEPVLVGEVALAGWTASGMIRSAVWRGWRPELDAADAVVE